MFKRFDINAPIIIFVNVGFLFILSAINSELAPRAYLVIPAIFIIPAALFLNLGWMIFTTVFSALMFEATTPIRAGLLAAVWLVAAFVVRGFRFRFRTFDWFSITALAEILNIILIAVYAVIFPTDSDSLFSYANRIASDALISALFLGVAAKYAVSLPVSLANIIGVDMSIYDGD